MSARGRKLTALTPRKANSRKIVWWLISYNQPESTSRKSNAFIDLRRADRSFVVDQPARFQTALPSTSTALDYALIRPGQLQIFRFTPPAIGLER